MRGGLRRLRRGGRRAGVSGVSALLCLGTGTGLLLASVTSGRAAADATLGGYTVSALAEASTAQYEQPNFPLPSNPSLEFDEGYAATSDNYGPTGAATASALYPGQVVANAGPELALLVPGAPLPPAPVWPVQAVSDYPQTPNSDSLDEVGANMDTTSTTSGNTATATLGDDAPTAGSSGTTPAATAGSGNPLGASSAIIGIAGSSSTSSSSAPAATATADATATDTGISLLGGFITIGAVTSTATASSDGTTGTVTGSTVVSNMTIAGESVTVTGSGIAAAGQNTPLALPIAAVNTLLNELGISLAVTSTSDKVQGAAASRTLDGLQISINLQTLDTAANTFASLFPASLTSQLPVAIPNDQVLTLDLATVSVSSDAAPPFDDSFSSVTATAPTAPSVDTGSDAFTAPTTSGDLGGGDDFGTGGTGVATATTPASATAPTTAAPGGSAPVEPASAVTPVFTGVGSGLLLIGLLLAALLAWGYKRVDDASELAVAGCAGGDPLLDRFADGDPALPPGGLH